jgi:hypothetical protein
MGIKCWNSTFNSQGSRIIVVEVVPWFRYHERKSGKCPIIFHPTFSLAQFSPIWKTQGNNAIKCEKPPKSTKVELRD